MSRTDALWKQLSERLVCPCFLMNEQGGLTFVSEAAQKQLALAPDAKHGLQDVFEGLDHQYFAKLKQRLFGNKMSHWMEVKRRGGAAVKAESEKAWFELVLIPFVEDDGKVTAVLGVVRDITALKKAEKSLRDSERLYRTLVETSPDSISLTDLEGNFLATNPQTAAFYGIDSVNGIVGKLNAFDVIHPNDRSFAVANLQKVLEERTVRRMRYRLKRAAGAYYWAEVSASLVCDADGSPTGFIGVVRDIDEQVRAEAEIAQRNEALAQANRQLERLHQTKDELIAMISHELRTPLVTGLGYVDLLLQGELGAISAEARARMQIARDNLSRLSALIGDILEFQKLGDLSFRRSLQKTAVDLAAICHECAEDFLLRSGRSATSLALEIDHDLPRVWADGNRIRQVIANLLDNAGRHAGNTAHIKVSAHRTFGRAVAASSSSEFSFPAGVAVTVSDNGVGISDALKDKVFLPFYRNEESCTGSGLGLAVVQKILEAHGCQPQLQSSPGQGTAIGFELQCAEDGDRKKVEPYPPRPVRATPKGRILAIDDDYDTLQFVALALQTGGYSVKTVTSAEAALATLQKETFAAILVDYTLPGMNGLSLIEHIKKQARWKDVPVILLTARAEETIQKGAAAAGCCRFLIKPIVTKTLISVLDEVCGE
jgi:PAS domain S-box-containing protein